MKKKRSRPGRRPGSKNITITATASPSRCPKCGSTARGEYKSRSVQFTAGKLPDGSPYDHICRRRTRCRSCGLRRVDRSFEYAKPLPAKKKRETPIESAPAAETC